MQVFLPFPDFQQSVQCLDPSRLGNQIWRECKTLLNGGWPNHPVAKMWADYKPALANYAVQGLAELKKRKAINDASYYEHLEFFWSIFLTGYTYDEYRKPPFVGNEAFHLSHRLNLLWKGQQDFEAGKTDHNWYTNYFSEPVPTSKPDYLWPQLDSPQKSGSVIQLTRME